MSGLATGCTNPAHRYLNHPPVPCHDCHGWLDSDGAVMSTDTMLQRYPFMRGVIAPWPPGQLPDYTPTRRDQALAANRLVGALARSFLAIIFAAAALAVVIVIMVQALR